MVVRSSIFITAVLAAVSDAVSLGSFDYKSLSLREVGARNTEVRSSPKNKKTKTTTQNAKSDALQDWRIWLTKDGDPISFWHDIPTWPDENDRQIINVVIEVPRWQDAKIEMARDEPMSKSQRALH